MNVFRLCAFLTGFVLAGCHTEVTNAPASIAGVVVSTDGKQIAGAQITINSRTIVSDSAGAFTVLSAEDANTYVGLRVKAAGYPESVRRVLMPSSGQLQMQFTLRPAGQVQTFTMPTGDQPVTLSINQNEAGATLSIPASSLVNSQGELVTGDANISLTFWSPDEDMTSIPGLLRASGTNQEPRDDSPINLLSYGMVDIEIEQDGNRLQVAPQATLPFALQTTTARRAAVASRPSSVKTTPTLWTLNPNTGLWDENVGDSNYNVATGTLTAVLRHLSALNADEPYSANGPSTLDGGCITGRAYGSCGQPLPGAVVTINVSGSLAGPNIPTNWTFITDETGTYKANVKPSGHNSYFASAVWHGHTTDMMQAPMDPTLEFESVSPATPTYPREVVVVLTCSDASGQCQSPNCACFNDPSDPGGCMEALQATDPSANSGYNPCWIDPLGSNWLGPCFDDLLTGGSNDLHFNTVWKNRTVGDLCSNCWPILDMVFKDVAGDQSPGCTGTGAQGQGCCPTTTPPGFYNVCNDLQSAHRKVYGDICSVGSDTCCGLVDGSALQCADNLCVPVTDPE